MVAILMGMAMLVAGSAGPVSAQGSGALAIPADSPDKVALGKQALEAALESYATESEAALESRMADLRSFFEERKSGTRRFAQSMLGIEGKVMVSGLAMQELLDAASGNSNKPSVLRKYVGDHFRSDVLDPATIKREVDRAVSGFLGDLAGIEARLLVRLKADIGDGELSIPRSLPNMEGVGKRQYDAMIGSTIDAALADIGVSLGMFVASNYVSGKIVDKAAPKEASKGGKFLVNLIVGIAVDKLLEEAAKGAGYDPEKKLADGAADGIDRIRGAVIDGDPALARFYPTLKVLRRMHPEVAVREACEQADESVKRYANLGLHERLRGLRNDRYRRLWVVLTARIVGEEAAKSPFQMYTPLDAQKCSPPDAIIRWADSITDFYGGKR
jgi:hypothetical protein